jgi:CubicO group peptidase (beta-lactamase class C family)
MTKSSYFLVFLLFFYTKENLAQVVKSEEIYKTILSQDSLLFTVGFNTCDISQYEKLLSKNLRFYHDKDGISDRTKFLSDLKNGLCKDPKSRQVKRVLVQTSTEIYPLFKNNILYAAIHNGEHLFYESPTAQPGSAKFSNLWQLEEGEWKLATSFSFAHGAYEQPAVESNLFDNDEKIEKWIKENNIPVLGLGIIEAGSLKQVRVFGETSKDVSAPYHTVFNVASLTKPVTAVVALKLVDLGKLDLDEPLYKYWTDPDIAKDPKLKKITARLILSHQTGFKNWRWLNEDKKLGFDFTPGTAYQYSGEGYEYLRKALENNFKKSLQQLAKELIFDPLNMTDTQYIWSEKLDSKRYALNYDKAGIPYKTVKNITSNAADDLLTTIPDYSKFLTSLMNGSLISDKMYKEMKTPHVASEKTKHFGLGFEIYTLENGEYALAHGGADDGVRTLFIILPETKQGLLIFTNSDTGGTAYEPLVKHYLKGSGQNIIKIENSK